MAKNKPSCDHVTVKDEFIDMDVSSSTFFFYGKPSPPRPREFEFQMSPEREAAAAPADELFYKGKILPLHLPPRLQMVQNLLQSGIDAAAAAATATASEPGNISPANSCELKREEHINQTRKSWPKKLKLIRHSYLALKLQASKAYLKALFTAKPGCYDESSDSAPNAATLLRSIERDRLLEEECRHRKSFSGAINCHLMSSCSSSSSSFSSVNSSRFHGSQTLNRSSSVNSEMEGSIQGAIAHCKKSHMISARKSFGDVELST